MAETANNFYRDPSELLDELGITRTEDIDVEAIAEHCGATVLYQPLEGAEARIIGHGDRAIISVSNTSARGRQRFSVGHELGHWAWDRGKVAFSCDDRKFAREWTGMDKESVANRYASDLLLPVQMFKPLANKKPVIFETVRTLADSFQTSLTATAIRLVQHGSFPSMVVCSDATGRKWFVRSRELDEANLWPRRDLSQDSLAFGLLHGTKSAMVPEDVDADVWIDHLDAGNYIVKEDSVKITPDLVLTLLWWKNESQLRDLSDDDSDDE
jgi:hypothetical protein